jgi:hypothetical protein
MDQPRDTPAPIIMHDAVKHGRRLRRHSPVSRPAVAGTPGAPLRSYGYAFFALRAQGSQARFVAPPWIRGCGVRNATRQGFSAASERTNER